MEDSFNENGDPGMYYPKPDNILKPVARDWTVSENQPHKRTAYFEGLPEDAFNGA